MNGQDNREFGLSRQITNLRDIRKRDVSAPVGYKGFYWVQMQKELEAAADARKQERKESRMALLGAGIGFVAGGSVGPGGAWAGSKVGAIAGASIGSMLAGGCIIITACTSPKSYAVKIAREYRDTILDKTTLGGYYALCEIVVPLIHKSSLFKRFIKKLLVDRMIDYFEVALNYKNRTEFRTSEIATKGFLGLCHLIGLHVNTEAWIALHA